MAKRTTRKKYEDTIYHIERNIPFFKSVNNNFDLNKEFKDKYSTKEQKIRDSQITSLLTYYVESYYNKRKSNPIYKAIIFSMSVLILLAFSGIFMYLIIRFSGSVSELQVNNVVSLITVCITYLALVIGILKIITKYVFPQKEEEYITRIVEMIQQNDLKNKKTNIKSSKKNDV